MLFPRFLNSAGVSLNGIPANYAPVYPADSVVQTLTPFEVVKEAPLMVLYAPAFKGIIEIGPTATSVQLRIDGHGVGTELLSYRANLSSDGITVTSTGLNGGVHFQNMGKSIIAGNNIEIKGFPISGRVALFLFEKIDHLNYSNSTGVVITVNNRTSVIVEKMVYGVGGVGLFTSTVDAFGTNDALNVGITGSSIIIKRNTTVLYTHNLQYKARLMDEAGTTVSANAGLLKLADGTAYTNGLVPANTELKYEVGTALGTYNVEIESELGRKILQKVIVVNGGIVPVTSITNPPLSFTGNTMQDNTSPASWWNRNKTYALVGAGFLAVALIGSWIINRLSK